MRGGKREGSGRPIVIDKKQAYTIRLRPDQVEWLKKQKRGVAAKIFEDAVDAAMGFECSSQNSHTCHNI